MFFFFLWINLNVQSSKMLPLYFQLFTWSYVYHLLLILTKYPLHLYCLTNCLKIHKIEINSTLIQLFLSNNSLFHCNCIGSRLHLTLRIKSALEAIANRCHWLGLQESKEDHFTRGHLQSHSTLLKLFLLPL